MAFMLEGSEGRFVEGKIKEIWQLVVNLEWILINLYLNYLYLRYSSISFISGYLAVERFSYKAGLDVWNGTGFWFKNAKEFEYNQS